MEASTKDRMKITYNFVFFTLPGASDVSDVKRAVETGNPTLKRTTPATE